MAEPTSKPGGTATTTGGGGRKGGGRTRMQIAGKLTALLGLPSILIFSIFGSGVYCGARSADRVVGLEQRWLGVEPPPGRVGAGSNTTDSEDSDSIDSTDSDSTEAPSEQPIAQPDEPKPTEPKPTEPKPVEPKPEAPANTNGLVVVAAAPVGPELRARFEEPRAVRVQLLIDPALVVGREDWFVYIAELFEATRTSFQVLYGIELELHGVLVWDSAVGADMTALEADLTTRDRHGAELMLGLLAREQPAKFTPPSWVGEVTGDHAFIFADLSPTRSGGDRYYRNMLRALSTLFGAEPVVDPASQQLGSFMSDSSGRAGAAPVLDPENRGKVIIHKRRPIRSGSTEPTGTEPLEGDI